MTRIIFAMIGVLFLGGLACSGVAIRSWWRARRRTRTGCVAGATVVELVPTGGSPDEPVFVTVVEFRDRAGTIHRVRSKWGESPASYAVGQRIHVSYEAGDPANADFVQETRSLIALGTLGLLPALIAVLLWWDLSHGGLTVG
jgi:hypothetical protein